MPSVLEAFPNAILLSARSCSSANRMVIGFLKRVMLRFPTAASKLGSVHMRIGFCGVRNSVIVLSALCGMCISQPAASQPAADFDVVEATIDSIHGAMRLGGLTCTKLVQTYLDRIAAYDQ